MAYVDLYHKYFKLKGLEKTETCVVIQFIVSNGLCRCSPKKS